MNDFKTPSIDLAKIRDVLQARTIIGTDLPEVVISGFFASDLMSDVLAFGKPGSLLLTGLNTIQSVISSHMAEFKAIAFLRGKVPTEDMQNFAKEKEIVLLSTNEDMYEACVRLAHIKNNTFIDQNTPEQIKRNETTTVHEFWIDGGDFASAGMVSTQIKSILKNIGYDLQLIRRVAISTYEGEMNVVMHAKNAKVILTASNKEINIIIDDEGKGIPDISLAMQEGFSTATKEQQAMGFGAGMGLPNIKRNSDYLDIKSRVNEGTMLEMRFFTS